VAAAGLSPRRRGGPSRSENRGVRVVGGSLKRALRLRVDHHGSLDPRSPVCTPGPPAGGPLPGDRASDVHSSPGPGPWGFTRGSSPSPPTGSGDLPAATWTVSLRRMEGARPGAGARPGFPLAWQPPNFKLGWKSSLRRIRRLGVAFRQPPALPA
jgi:hypothetical protein